MPGTYFPTQYWEEKVVILNLYRVNCFWFMKDSNNLWKKSLRNRRGKDNIFQWLR